MPAGRSGKETAGGVGGVRARLAAPAVLAGGRAGGGGRRAGGQSWPSTLAAALGEMRVEGERESTVRDKVPT